jgi:hypothetical protein
MILFALSPTNLDQVYELAVVGATFVFTVQIPMWVVVLVGLATIFAPLASVA